MNNFKLNIKSLIIAMMMAVSSLAVAQDEPAFTVSGSIDTYFRTNLSGGTNDPTDGGTLAPVTSFANLPGFSLGMANVIMSYDGDKVGFVADLVFGPRGAEAVFGSNPALNIVNQLNAYINVTDNFKLTLGNFNTFLGYEVISPTANFNYSTSYMFSYGPFSHSGIKADFALGESFSLAIAYMNPTDATDFNPVNEYVTGLQLGYSAGSGSAYLNVLASEDFFQIDLTTGWNLSESFYLGVNATSQTGDASADFYGAAGYLQLSVSDALALGIRGEYFSDGLGGILGAIDENGDPMLDESVFATTISAPYTSGSLTIIPEIRLDALSFDGYTDSDGDVGSSLSSFVLAAVYAF
jgi:hypothetical protein